ncbi:MAG: hypothetical protein JJ896_02230 [Rhodothermales bacterium]|nr:hypothetical protein [Rhodothermales bacterium]MBO6778447.1 hypothetical protein [Rhodothermales bacterium]
MARLGVVCASLLLLTGCTSGISVPERAFDQLTEYGFFEGDLAALQPADGVLPYDLNSPLFSDYAEKARFVWMPEGTSATYSDDGVFAFPEDAVLIKNFYYNAAAPGSERRILETRLLINRGDDWEAVGYIWNDEQTEAFRDVVGAVKPVQWTDASGAVQSVDYIIPNRNQCKSCHLAGKQQVPIGPSARNLNKTFVYRDGAENQLAKWAEKGYLSGFDPAAAHPRVADWNDPAEPLHDRAMAYLDVNCGHCHNPAGSANTSGLHLVADAPMDISLGLFKAPVSAGSGTGGRPYSIVPGDPDQSILLYRMQSTDPAERMPELGRSLVHHDGVVLIRQWIQSMEAASPLTP